MGGGAGPAVLSPDEAPADDAQAPIDLVSDTSESAGSLSDSDHSSDVAIVEPVDQAAAVIPCAADLLAASDFTPHLLNDMHAPMVTVIRPSHLLACWPACPTWSISLAWYSKVVSQRNSLLPVSRLWYVPTLTWPPTWPRSWQASSIGLALRPSLMHWLTMNSWGAPCENQQES